MICALNTVPDGGSDVSEIVYPLKCGTQAPDCRRPNATQP